MNMSPPINQRTGKPYNSNSKKFQAWMEAQGDRPKVDQSSKRSIPVIKARYDAAQTNRNNENHWSFSDALSADAAASETVRATLRQRARYEVQNNSYARGITYTIANDEIGTGPRLQLLTDDQELNSLIEREWDLWSRRTSYAEKLRTMRLARLQDGESFALMANNPRLEGPVKLDLKLIEADQVTDPDISTFNNNDLDGIRLDAFGNPASYLVLNQHPGGNFFPFGEDFKRIPARNMIHVFKQERPGQHRGLPEIMSALPLFAMLRRYTLAVLNAAEAVANVSAVLFTDAPANDQADDVGANETLEFERDQMITLPAGWKLDQIDPRQPAATYNEFKKEIINEIARCLNMPFNIAAGNSAGYNYSSGRLDHQMYFRSILVDRNLTEIKAVDPTFAEWLFEFNLVAGPFDGLSISDGDRMVPDHLWHWDGFEHQDPQREAKAQDIKLDNRTTNLAIAWGREGGDWQKGITQGLIEEKFTQDERKRIGLDPIVGVEQNAT